MRWEDEDFVKLYTDDSPEWLAVPLASRCFFWELMRKCDRAGIIRLGKKGVRALAAAVHGTLEEVEAALPPLIEDGCVVLKDDRLVIPNFVKAQSARASDKARKQTERQRDRDLALAASESVTPCHAPSRGVASESRGEERRGEEREEKREEAAAAREREEPPAEQQSRSVESPAGQEVPRAAGPGKPAAIAIASPLEAGTPPTTPPGTGGLSGAQSAPRPARVQQPPVPAAEPISIVPSREARLAERFPFTVRLLDVLRERWPALRPPSTETDFERLEEKCRTRGESPLARDLIAFAEGRGVDPERMTWFARVLDDVPEVRAPRPPGELPNPGDPDFNDPGAYPSWQAYQDRAGPPLPVPSRPAVVTR